MAIDETDNHGYNVPDKGTEDWHVPLNENFNQFEVDIEIRDTDGNRSLYTPVDGAKFLATDTGEVFLGDGSDWTSIGTIGGGGSGDYSDSDAVDAINNDADHGTSAPHNYYSDEKARDAIGAALVEGQDIDITVDDAGDTITIASTVSVSGQALPPGVETVSDYSGDLGARINSAISNLPGGRGVVIVNPKADGSAWSLSTSVDQDVSGAGLEIWAPGKTQIDIQTGVDWVFDLRGGTEAWNDPVDALELHGGYWEFTDAWDGDGFARIDDMYGAHFHGFGVIDCRNSTDDAVGIQIRNVDHFSEGNYLEHIQFREVDIGVDHVPASVTGGTGTQSFHNEKMSHVHIDGLQNIGVRFQDGCQLAASGFDDVAMWPASNGVIGWAFSAEPDGCTIRNPKFEGPGSDNAVFIDVDQTAFKNIGVEDPMITAGTGFTLVDDPGDGQGIHLTNLDNNGAAGDHEGFRGQGIYCDAQGNVKTRDWVNETDTTLHSG